MALIIQTIPSVNPTPRVVAPSVVRQQARLAGRSGSAATLAVTVPIITTDQTQLRYEQQRTLTGIDFRFETGTLTLRLRQEIYISNELSTCAQRIWNQHEMHHVEDNRRLMSQMDREIRSDPTLRAIFIRRQWLPRDSFNLIQDSIRQSVANIFRRLTGNAARRRDSTQEYARVQREILNRCPEPFYYTVERGDNLSRIAQFFYNRSSRWSDIYEANRREIGTNPNRILPGQRLRIPR